MSDIKQKSKLEKLHFYLLGLVLINLGIGLITSYTLIQNISYPLKVILYLTGVILFFTKIEPFNKKVIYYSFYVISSVLIILSFLFKGLFLTILSSIFLYPIYPKEIEYKTESIKIYDRFQGLIAPCCSYEVVETKIHIFEKHLGYINIQKPIDGKKDEFNFKNNSIIYKYKIDNTTIVRDTTEILNFE